MEGWLWAFAPDADEMRRIDCSLSESQAALRERYADFFSRHCPSSLVREAEPFGFDAALWESAAALGLASLRLDASTVDLVLAAEEAGRAMAPIPYAETAVTVPLLALCSDDAAQSRLQGALDGSYISTLAPRPTSEKTTQLVPAGAIAQGIVALDGDELALFEPSSPRDHVYNLAMAPLAWWSPDDRAARTVLAPGDAARELYAAAIAEWRLATSAALIGMAHASIRMGVEFATTRLTSGVPIGALQGVSHPLADTEVSTAATRNLVLKAAWFHDHERDVAPELVPMALVKSEQTATAAVATSLHMQGGHGYTIDSEVSLAYRRVKGIGTLADPRSALLEVGDALVGKKLRPGAAASGASIVQREVVGHGL
jgi:alkylation response protein AidB-like acyl-CoA dehydrogenase